MAKELRLGVIGAGSWAVAALLPALSPRSEDVELVGVCGSNFETLARIQDQFGFQMSSPDDREVLAQEVDITLMPSPPGLHHRQATAKRRPGAIVLQEKPMTITREKARGIVREAAKNPRKLLCSSVWSCMRKVKTALGTVRDFGIGPLKHLAIHMSSPARERLNHTDSSLNASVDTIRQARLWTDSPKSGGGDSQAHLSYGPGIAGALVPDENAVGAHAGLWSPVREPEVSHAPATAQYSFGGSPEFSGASCHVGPSGNKHELEVRAVGSEHQFILDAHRELVWVFCPDGTDVTATLEAKVVAGHMVAK